MSEPPPPRQPMLNLPSVVAGSCAVLLAVYLAYAFAPIETQTWAVAQFGFVPARAAIALDIARPALRGSVQQLPQDAFAMLIGSGGGRWWSLVTYAFLHNSFATVGLNCVWLVVFGSPVARRFGAARFLALVLVAIVIGALFCFLWNPASFLPIVGAAAGVAGTAGAAVRFVFRPGTGEAMLDPLRRTTAFRQPALTLSETFANSAGLLFIALFLGSGLLPGLFPGAPDAGQIAWQSQVGGFLAGLLLFPLFDPPHPPVVLDVADSTENEKWPSGRSSF